MKNGCTNYRVRIDFSCVIFFKFVSVLNFCLAHLALLSKKVNKHDNVIFPNFRKLCRPKRKTKNGMKSSYVTKNHGDNYLPN